MKKAKGLVQYVGYVCTSTVPAISATSYVVQDSAALKQKEGNTNCDGEYSHHLIYRLETSRLGNDRSWSSLLLAAS